MKFDMLYWGTKLRRSTVTSKQLNFILDFTNQYNLHYCPETTACDAKRGPFAVLFRTTPPFFGEQK